MLKKVVLGTLLAGLIGILVAGAVIRTVDKTAQVAEARGGGGSQGHGYGHGDSAAISHETGQESDCEEHIWLTLQGVVVSVDEDALVVRVDSSEEVVVEGRPWRFAQEQGFSTQVGDKVTLVGFYEDGTFEAGQISDATNGQTVLIREESGRPLWAGRGRRGW